MAQPKPSILVTVIARRGKDDRQTVRSFKPSSLPVAVTIISSLQLTHHHASAHTAAHIERYYKKQEAQLPLREQGVSFVLSYHHNATPGILAF